MKKLFLFMLTALLSVTGYAADLNKADISVGNVVYGSTSSLTIAVYDAGVALAANTDYVVESGFFTDEECSASAGTDLTLLNVGTYYVKLTGKGLYLNTEAVRSFKVTPKPLTLVTKAGQKKTFGAADPATYEYTKVQNGGVDLLAAEIASLNMVVGRTAGENAGTYDFTATVTNPNYTIVTDGANKFTIEQKDLSDATITITVKASNDYTAAENKTTVTIKDAGNKVSENVAASNFTIEYYTDGARTAAATAVKDAATYYLKIVGQNNYTGTVADKEYVINKVDAVVTYSNVTKEYDATADFTAVPSYFGIKEVDMPLFSGVTHKAITNKNVGTHTNVVTEDVSTLNGISTNYTYSVQPANLTITAAPLTITADDQTCKYGENAPTLTYTITGLKGTDTKNDAIHINSTGTDASKNIKLTTTYKKGNNVGTYQITISTVTAKSNYTVKTKTAGKLTVNATDAAVTFFAYNDSKTYGDADPTVWGANPATALKQGTHYLVTGLESASDLKGTPVLTRSEGENAGSYTITISGENLVDSKKYSNVKFSNGAFTIKPAELTVKVNDQTLHTAATASALGVDKTYGVAYTVSGLKNGDKETDLGSNLTITVTDAEAAMAGVYDNKIQYTKTNANYALTGTTTGKVILVNPATIILNDNADVVTTEQDGVDVTFSDRVLKGETWNVLVLPFEVTVKDLSQALDYAVVDAFDETADDGNVHFKLNVKKIAANTPFLVYPTEDKNLNTVTFTGVDVKAASANVEKKDLSNNKFIGIYKATEITGEKQYFMNTKGEFKYAGSNTYTIKPLRAILDLSANTNAARATIFIEQPDGTIDAVKAIEADGVELGNTVEGIYNLSGVRVQKAQKGIYIKNGKKIVVK